MNPKPDTARNAPEPDEIRSQIAHMLASDIFRGSPQLASFLQFVVSAALRGDSHRIKAYTIAVEVMRRDTKFDPQTDPIVRVEATRLRRALERYYTGPGTGDAIVVSLPLGSYVPQFQYAGIAARNTATSAEYPGLVPNLKSLAPGNGMPVLSVRPIETRGVPEALANYGHVLHEKLRNAFSRFDTINIVSNLGLPMGGCASSSDEYVDYELLGTIHVEADRASDVLFELYDRANTKVIWSGAFELDDMTAKLPDQDRIVLELTSTLLQPFGIIRTYERSRHLAGGSVDPRYRCIVEASESFRSFAPQAHERARQCLQMLTSTYPDFGIGFSYLAAIYFREYLYNLGGNSGGSAALDRSLRAARRGIELIPESARAYHILFGALFHGGDLTEAFVAGAKAMKLNPYDMTILADYGGRLILTGEIERGMAILDQAVQGGLILPTWEHFYVFLGNYLQGNFRNAAFHAGQMTSEHYPLGFIARALVAIKLGNGDQARAQINQLTGLMPTWATDPRRQMQKFFPNPAIADQLKQALVAAGLRI